MIIFGVAILLGWQVARWIGGPGLATTEFPLGDPHDVAVDSHGRIYVAENFYGRVQRYSLPYVENVRTGEQIVVTPVLTRLVAAPFPAILYAATGFALFAAAEWRRRHAVPANPPMHRTATASSRAVQ